MRLHSKLLLAIVSVIVISLFSLGCIVYVQLHRQSEEALLQQMETMLSQTERQITAYIDTAQANSWLFANSSLIKRYVLIESEAERFDLFQPALLTLFSSYLEAYPQYQEIRLLTPDGYEDTRMAKPELPNLTEEEGENLLFRKLERNHGPFFSHIGANPDTGATTLFVGRPIHLKDRDVAPASAQLNLRGFLALTASLDFVAEHLAKQSIGRNGYLMLLNKQGKVLFHKNPQINGSSLYSLMFELEKNAETDQKSNMEIRGKSSIVKWRSVNDNLTLVAVVPDVEFKTLSLQVAKTVTTITLLAILLTTITFYMLIHSTVLRPIMRLRQTAISIGDGLADTPVDISREDEIGDLARALNDMNSKLGTSMKELQHSHARIEQLAYRDSLTGLPNRRLFMNQVEQAMAMEDRHNGKLAILFLDLDDFKRVNDTMGHEAGDTLLREVAIRLQHCIRESDELVFTNGATERHYDQVARLGGDEFIILLTALGHADHASIVAKRIIAELAKPVIIEDRSFVVGTSIGISMYPDDATDVDGLIKSADTAMYEAKHALKNTFRYYGAPMQATIETRLKLEEDLRTAMQREEFELFFQPQFNTRSGELAGAEVLLRWQHPIRGMVPPDVFIPVAEDTGMIGELGEWILMQACRQWREWHDQGIAPIRIAVNVSQRQFALGDLTQAVSKALQSNQMDASILELELTESCMMEAPSAVVETLHTLRNLGVRVAMDDFGTGYSSLGALTSLPIDTLKIDRSFVSGIDENSQNSKVVSAILMLARSLDLEIVAEGVEVQAELDYLAERDCDIVQGYLLGRPLPASSMSDLLMTIYKGELKKAS